MSNFTEQSAAITAEEVFRKKAPDSLERRVFRSSIVVIATCSTAYVIWTLIDLLLLLFACALVSLILLTLSRAIRQRTNLPLAVSLGMTVFAIVLLLGGAITFFGATIQAEFAELATRLPGAWINVQQRLQTSAMGSALLVKVQELAPSGQALVSAATTALAALGGALSGLAIVLVGGLYLAAQPGLYSAGLLRLIPARARTPAAETLDAMAISLRNWLKGQALGMLFVGTATGLGLWLVGVPAAWAIGLVAGLAEFVPYAGIFLAAVPAVVLGFGQGTSAGLWTIGVMVAVQQFQGNLVMPLLQDRMVDLPPAITIFGIIAAGILFGVPGVLLATPLTIVVLVLVRRLYLREDVLQVLASGDGATA